MRNSHLARVLAHRAAQKETNAYSSALADIDGNSCSVHALRLLTGLSYVEAHSAVKKIGRETGRGLLSSKIDEYLKLFEEFGFKLIKVACVPAMSGKYLIVQQDHLAAWVDGRVLNGYSRRGIESIWRVEPA